MAGYPGQDAPRSGAVTAVGVVTLVLGDKAITAILALLSVPGIGQNPGNALLNIAIFGGYTAFVYIVLMKNGAEFA